MLVFIVDEIICPSAQKIRVVNLFIFLVPAVQTKIVRNDAIHTYNTISQIS
jgi:hypothetical protein